MQRELHITATGDLQLTDDVQRGSTQHLILLVPQSLGGSHHDTVTGVYAHRVDIFHVADGDHISCTVPHHLILNLFPSGNAALHQNLTNTAEPQAVG